MKNSYTELCFICENEVSLEVKSEIQICPICGTKIKPCVLCNMDNVDCSKCYLEQL